MILLPFAAAIMKVGAVSMDLGDLLSTVSRLIFPAYPLASTVMFNSEMIKWLADARFE